MASVNVLFSKQKKLKLGALNPTDENIKRFLNVEEIIKNLELVRDTEERRSETLHFEL